MEMETVGIERARNASGLVTPVTIQGVGAYIPDEVITNEMLTQTLETTNEWIQVKTGIEERRFLQEGLVTSDMCVYASNQAINDAGISAGNLDAIILTSTTPDQKLPSTALIIKEKIGATNAIPIDLNQTGCAGGIFSIMLGAHLLQNDNIHNVLVIGAEVLSRITNPEDRSTRVFLGDAAGAMILQKTKEGSGILSWNLDSSLSNAVEITGGGTKSVRGEDINKSQFIKMNGREVWKMATKNLPNSICSVIENAGLEVKNIDHFILHQANLNIIKEAMSAVGASMDKTTLTVQEQGNTGSATIFSAFNKAMSENKIKQGDYVVFSAIGAGFLWGSICLKYIKNEEKGFGK
ncbi:ketoacyl-ACP synthase III [Bacillus thuringiensis serovar finitimus]|nr:3-oxoacyl-(acyl-carrier-protein) synthase III [Bacillus thuringiensis serovar finitimus YBT-020]OTX78281.1 ketoacyl-ACP synthase III [Bacillus thuringiensis serovar finitimus]